MPRGGVAWRWLLPLAATALAVAAAVWQSDRASRRIELPPPKASADWRGKGVDLPVLPPRAYWEMSATEEFARLRPGRALPEPETSGIRH